jgi:monoamine oxidase
MSRSTPLSSTVIGITRRQLMRRAALAAGAAMTTSLIRDLRAADKPANPLHVIVIGAGLAGLVAAYELEKLGHTVTLLEAEAKHVGGRARTLRFEGDLYGEAGAMRIPQRHEITRHYVKELGLTLRPFVHSNPEAYYYLRGTKERIKNVKNLNHLYRLTEAEKNKTPDDLWADAVGSVVKKLTDSERADLSADVPQTDAIRRLDQQSLQALCESAGLSAEATEYLAVTNGQEMEMFTGATETVREEVKEFWSLTFDEIVGGTDRLPAAFAEKLRSKPKLGCEVIALQQDAARHKAAATYVEAGKEQRVEGDFVLCTLPLPVLQRLKTDPALSPEKQRAIREVNYDSSTKVLAVCNGRFWELHDGIFGGGTYTDLPTGTTYYPSDNAIAKGTRVSASAAVFLASYTWGMAARRLAALPHRQRADLVIKHLALVHPELLKENTLLQTASWSWDNHPNSGGAFAWYLPGQYAALHRHVISPEGRIFFAGEHASVTHTWMQGALESALRAVREMTSLA